MPLVKLGKRASVLGDVAPFGGGGALHAIGSLVALDNATETVIGVQNQWEDLNLNALAVAGSNITLWSVSDTTIGELTYNGSSPFDGRLLAVLSVVSAMASQEFQFRAVKNGLVLSDGVKAARDLGISLGNMSLLTPVQCVEDDIIRLQVRNVSGTSNVTVLQLSIDIS